MYSPGVIQRRLSLLTLMAVGALLVLALLSCRPQSVVDLNLDIARGMRSGRAAMVAVPSVRHLAESPKRQHVFLPKLTLGILLEGRSICLCGSRSFNDMALSTTI